MLPILQVHDDALDEVEPKGQIPVTYRFGPYVLDTGRRLLCTGGSASAIRSSELIARLQAANRRMRISPCATVGAGQRRASMAAAVTRPSAPAGMRVSRRTGTA